MPDLPAGAERVFRDDSCANCLAPLPRTAHGLFCDDWCREVSKHVRYIRGVYGDGRILDPEVKYAVDIRLAHMLAGGYDARARFIPPDMRTQVVARDGGQCVQCGAPGQEIDHIAGSSRELGNLQLLCRDCHHAKTAENVVPASDESKTAVSDLFRRRVSPEVPLLLADGEDWRSVERRLRAARWSRLSAQGVERPRAHRGRGPALKIEWEEGGVPDDELDSNWAIMPVTEDDDSPYGPDSYFARATQRDD